MTSRTSWTAISACLCVAAVVFISHIRGEPGSPEQVHGWWRCIGLAIAGFVAAGIAIDGAIGGGLAIGGVLAAWQLPRLFPEPIAALLIMGLMLFAPIGSLGAGIYCLQALIRGKGDASLLRAWTLLWGALLEAFLLVFLCLLGNVT